MDSGRGVPSRNVSGSLCHATPKRESDGHQVCFVMKAALCREPLYSMSNSRFALYRLVGTRICSANQAIAARSRKIATIREAPIPSGVADAEDQPKAARCATCRRRFGKNASAAWGVNIRLAMPGYRGVSIVVSRQQQACCPASISYAVSEKKAAKTLRAEQDINKMM